LRRGLKPRGRLLKQSVCWPLAHAPLGWLRNALFGSAAAGRVCAALQYPAAPVRRRRACDRTRVPRRSGGVRTRPRLACAAAPSSFVHVAKYDVIGRPLGAGDADADADGRRTSAARGRRKRGRTGQTAGGEAREGVKKAVSTLNWQTNWSGFGVRRHQARPSSTDVSPPPPRLPARLRSVALAGTMASPVPFVLVVGFHHQLGPQVRDVGPSPSPLVSVTLTLAC